MDSPQVFVHLLSKYEESKLLVVSTEHIKCCHTLMALRYNLWESPTSEVSLHLAKASCGNGFHLKNSMNQRASLFFTISQSLLKLMSIESVMPSNYLILCQSLLLLSSIFPSIRVFSNEPDLLIRWPTYWSFSFSISPSNEYSGLISFRIDWFDLLAIQGTLKSLLQHHSSKASVPWHSAFLMVQLIHPYMTAGKIISFTRWTFVSKVMALLFNMLSRLVIAFLPRSKCPLISWLH
ncbi:unnamed protein product [Rangifer tarandus platyrhynchus]|uniref:Uncharacterized protein n=1 Tax=Rangifer tarandus platyrhynchus TaxID=3082113 RepID=A0AC59Y2N4_RANTA